jgi:hypothetical protein
MNFNNIVSDIGKYHYLFHHGKHTILLSTGNSLVDVKKAAHKKIKSKLNIFEGRNIIRLKISKIKSSIYRDSKTAKLTSIGGPIAIDITILKVSPNGKMKIDEMDDRNTTVYVTESFLKKNGEISFNDLKKLARKVGRNKLEKSLLAVKTL